MNHATKIPKLAIWLVAGYVALQLAADVAAVKMVQVGPWVLPAGTLVYAITFTWRDWVHEKLGFRNAVNTIWAAAGANVVLSLYLLLAVQMPAASWWPGQEAFASTLALVPRITIASILAEVVSQLFDTSIYELLLRKGFRPVVRVALSNTGGILVDSALFAALAFSFTMPGPALLQIVAGQIVFKFGVSALTLPFAKLGRTQ